MISDIVGKDWLKSLSHIPDAAMYHSVRDPQTGKLRLEAIYGRWEEIMGVSIEESTADINKVFSNIVPEDMVRFRQAITESIENLSNYQINVRYNHPKKPGEEYWIQISSYSKGQGEGANVYADGFVFDITDRKKKEAELDKYHEELLTINDELQRTRSEIEYQLLKMDLAVNSAHIGLWDMKIIQHDPMNPNNHIHWSDELRQLLGFSTTDEFPNLLSCFTSRLHPEDSERLEKAVMDHLLDLTGQTPYNLDVRLQKKSGDYGYFHAFGTSQRDNDGNPIRFAGAIRDITDERLILEELRRSKEQLESSLGNNLPDTALYRMAYRSKDEKYNTEHVTAQWEALTGISLDEIYENTMTFFNAVHPNDMKHLREAVKTSRTCLTNLNEEVRFYKNEEVRWLHVTGHPYKHNDNVIWDGMIRDISVRKETEEKLRFRKQNLLALSRRQNVLIRILQIIQSSQSLPEAIDISLAKIGKHIGVSRVYVFTKNADGTTISNTHEWCNDGIEPCINTIQNRPITPTEQCWFDTAFKAGDPVYASNINTFSPETVEWLSSINVKSILLLPLTSYGENYGYIGLDECVMYREWETEDIKLLKSLSQIISTATQRHIAETNLIHAKERAEESDKLKSSFLANMSHEIRTPLNAIVGFLQFIDPETLTPEYREYINEINNSSEHLIKIVNDIIDISKIEAKQMTLLASEMNVNDMMVELYVLYEKHLVSTNKKSIELVIDDSNFIFPCVIHADVTHLRQIISKLLDNAIKFTEKGFISFGYQLNEEAGMLEFSVHDSGIGMPQSQLEVIFESFRQTELGHSRLYGGIGVGLTIARELTKMMGGTMWVESTEDSGSSFYFTIPYK